MNHKRSVWVGVGAGCLMALFTSLVYLVLRPLHQAGYGQGVSDFLIGLEHLLQAPGAVLVRSLGFHISHHRQWYETLVAMAGNVAVYFFLGWLAGSLWGRLNRRGEQGSEGSVPQRRRFLARTIQVAGVAATTGLAYALVAEPRWFNVTRRSLPVRGLPTELNGLRLVQLTDIHHGPWLAIDPVRQIVDTVNEQNPDVVLLTGDYVSESPKYISPVVAELSRLNPRIGTVAVLGNHDWWEDGPEIQRQLTAAGFLLLDNTRRILTPQRQWSERELKGLAFCGVGDLWTDDQDYAAALGGLPDDMPRLLLSHNPDVAEEPAFRSCGQRVDLMISGHTHGGQVQVPFMGTPVVPSKYGQKYASGLAQGPTCPVFICRGIGLSVLPLRMGVTPEIAVLELVSV